MAIKLSVQQSSGTNDLEVEFRFVENQGSPYIQAYNKRTGALLANVLGFRVVGDKIGLVKYGSLPAASGFLLDANHPLAGNCIKDVAAY